MLCYLILKLFIDQVEINIKSRRAFSIKFIGDDVKYINRGGPTSPPFDGINLKSGDVLREDWFPEIFNS